MLNHTSLLNEKKSQWEARRQKVYVEGQNSFRLRGKSATLAGRPDLIVVRNNHALIIDVKAGREQPVLADKGYDAQEFRQHILELGMMPVIPPRSNRKAPADYDRHLCRERHLVECFINKIKHYRRIFSRFEKLDTRYLGFLHFTAALIWLR